MELTAFLSKEQSLIQEEIEAKKKVNEIIGKRMELYKNAPKSGIYWESVGKKWDQEVKE